MLYLFQQLNNLLGETFVLVFHLLKLALVVGLSIYLWRRFGQRLFSSDEHPHHTSTPTPPPTVNAPSSIYRQPNTSAGNGTPGPLLPPDLKARALRFYRATVIPIKLGNGKTFNLHTLPVVLLLLLL